VAKPKTTKFTDLTPQALASLSREDKLELLAVLEEKERRRKAAKDAFKPHPGQLTAIQSTALERYLFPGNGYGKTALLVNEMHWAATGTNPVTCATTPVPIKAALVLATAKEIEDVLVEYARWHNVSEDQLHKKGKPHVSLITWPNGSSVTIYTHEVTPMSLEGSQWTHLFFNEPPPKPVFIALTRGGRIKDRPLRVLLAGTPIAASWLRSDVYEPWSKGELPHVECFFGSSYENAHNLDEGAIDRFALRLSDREKQVRIYGQFFDMDGLALAHLFKRETHVLAKEELAWDETWPCVVAMDPHPSKKHYAVLLGADKDNRLYVLDEYAEKAVARTFMRSLIERGWFTQYRVIDTVYDSLGSSDTTSGEGFRPFGDVINEVLRASGLGRARATRYEDKSDEDFVERIQDSLVLPTDPDSFGQRVPKLRVLSHCVGTVRDIENVAWLPDKKNETNKPKLDISNKDWLACVKYALACNLSVTRPKDHAFYVRKAPYGLSLRSQKRRTGP
jgi:hypothetical protein